MKRRAWMGLALTLCACLAHADAGASWIIRAGVHPMQPQPRNHEQVHVGDGAAITLAGAYMLDERWAIEAFASLPVEHDVYLDVGERRRVATIKQLPPTVSVQYHFLDPNGRIRAYVGLGLNYTLFFDEQTTGAWESAEMSLKPSLGPAAQLGLDLYVGRVWFVSIDARWFDIDSRGRVNGASLGRIDIDPYAVGMSVGRRVP